MRKKNDINGVTFGLIVGVCLGIISNHLALGISLGIAIGGCIDIVKNRNNKKK